MIDLLQIFQNFKSFDHRTINLKSDKSSEASKDDIIV